MPETLEYLGFVFKGAVGRESLKTGFPHFLHAGTR